MPKSEITLGGQAVVEGVLMRNKTHYSVAVRNEKGKIVTKKKEIRSSKNKISHLPVVRGMVALWETTAIGFSALIWSSQVAVGDDEKLSKKEMALAIIMSVALAIGIFIAIPFFIAHSATKDSFLFNIIDGILRLAALFGYLVVISFFKDVKRLFQYHGAEHMTIHAYEHDEKLIPKNIRKYRTMHPRCGTSFLLIVVIVSVFVFSLITAESIVVKFLSRLVLIPLIAGLSYEVLKFSAKHQKNPLIRPLTFPGIWLQYITTKQPDDKQIEVAVASLKELSK